MTNRAGILDFFNNLQGNKLKYGLAGLFIFVVIMIINPIVTIEAGHRGVVLNFGAVQEQILDEGIHFRIPIMQKIIEMDVRILKSRIKADAATRDLQDTTFEIVLNHHIDYKKVNWVYQKIGMDYENKVITPSVEEGTKAVSAKYTAEELITQRDKVSDEIKALLRQKLTGYNIIVDNFSIVNFKFSAQFTQAIEEKQTAEQRALKAQRDLDRIKIEAKQKIERARAEALELRLKRSEVTAQLIKLREIDAKLEAIKKWDGTLPRVTSGAVPFINVDEHK